MTLYNTCDLLGKYERSFFYDHSILNYVHSDVMVYISKNIKIKRIYITFNLENIFFAHCLTLGIFDYGNCGIKLIKAKMLVYLHTLASLDMIQNEAFFYFSYV